MVQNAVWRTCSFINKSSFIWQLNAGWIGRGREEKQMSGKTQMLLSISSSFLFFASPWGMKDLLPHLLGVLPADNLKLSDPFGDSFMEREPLAEQYTAVSGWPASSCVTGEISEGSGHLQTTLVSWRSLWSKLKLDFFSPILLPSLPFHRSSQEICAITSSQSQLHRESSCELSLLLLFIEL